MMIRTFGTSSYLGAAAAAMVAAGTLVGCSVGGSPANAATAHPEQRMITVDSVPAAEDAGLYVAQAQGLFARQGLTVKIDSVTGSETALPDLQTGRAQLVAGNYVSFVMAQMAGSFNKQPVDIRIIAAGAELQPGTEALYVVPKSKYQTVAELARAHARIGLNTPDDVGDVMVSALLEQSGYTMSDIKQVIPKGGLPALPNMLSAGQVDAAWLPQPLGEMAEQQLGATPIADFDQGALESFPVTGYLGAAKWVKSHPRTVAAFLKALNEGQRLADTDRSAVEAALEKYMGITPIVAATMPIDSYPLEIDVPQLQRVADSIFEFGLMPGAKVPYQISTMIQPEPGLIAR
jgi:NitT/TauT family transport system substrate-binding protein